MKAFVINLTKAKERMAFQVQQLNELEIEYQRLPAISISDVTTETYQKYYTTWERPLRYSEVACFLSHKLAWERVLEENVPILVLEDDALLSQQLPCLLQELERLHDVDFATLEVRGRKKIVAKEITHTFCDTSLIRLYQDRTGAAGYVLWPNGAKKLLERANKGKIALADAFISSSYSLNAYQIEPAAIIQLDQCEYYGITPPIETESSIASEEKPHPKTKRTLPFKIKRIFGQITLGLRQLNNFRRSSRRYVEVSESFQSKFVEK